MSRDIKALMRVAEQQGWIVVLRRSGHVKWQSPSGDVYFSSSTPSDHRAMMNLKADLRRRGLIAQ